MWDLQYFNGYLGMLVIIIGEAQTINNAGKTASPTG